MGSPKYHCPDGVLSIKMDEDFSKWGWDDGINPADAIKCAQVIASEVATTTFVIINHNSEIEIDLFEGCWEFSVSFSKLVTSWIDDRRDYDNRTLDTDEIVEATAVLAELERAAHLLRNAISETVRNAALPLD